MGANPCSSQQSYQTAKRAAKAAAAGAGGSVTSAMQRARREAAGRTQADEEALFAIKPKEFDLAAEEERNQRWKDFLPEYRPLIREDDG